VSPNGSLTVEASLSTSSVSHPWKCKLASLWPGILLCPGLLPKAIEHRDHMPAPSTIAFSCRRGFFVFSLKVFILHQICIPCGNKRHVCMDINFSVTFRRRLLIDSVMIVFVIVISRRMSHAKDRGREQRRSAAAPAGTQRIFVILSQATVMWSEL
jgi:hypothetical protein